MDPLSIPNCIYIINVCGVRVLSMLYVCLYYPTLYCGLGSCWDAFGSKKTDKPHAASRWPGVGFQSLQHLTILWFPEGAWDYTHHHEKSENCVLTFLYANPRGLMIA